MTPSVELALKFTIVTFLAVGWIMPPMIGAKSNRATIQVAVLSASIVFAGTMLLNYFFPR
jgi:hypothetical protein